MRDIVWALIGSIASAAYWMGAVVAVYVFAQGDLIPTDRPIDTSGSELRRAIVIAVAILVYAALLLAWRKIGERSLLRH